LDNDKKTKINEDIEEAIRNYSELIIEGYNPSDIFQKLADNMRDNKDFTATELITAICIAYDEKTLPIIIKEFLRLCPIIFNSLQEMNLTSNLKTPVKIIREE
jgi:hypothetical protein